MYFAILLYRIIFLALSSCVHNNRLWAPPLAYNSTLLVNFKLFKNYPQSNPLNRYLRSLGTLSPRSRTPGHQTLLVY